jgi:hypothetical protein
MLSTMELFFTAVLDEVSELLEARLATVLVAVAVDELTLCEDAVLLVALALRLAALLEEEAL